MVGERLSSSGTRLDVTSPVQSVAPVGGLKTSTESVHRALKSVSRQSLLGKITLYIWHLLNSDKLVVSSFKHIMSPRHGVKNIYKIS